MINENDFLLRKSDFVVIDTETTGYSPVNSELIEIAAIHWKNNKEAGSFQTLIKPENRITRESMAVHHITNEMVADAPSPEEAISKFREFVKNKIIVFHNASFDKKFLDYYLEKCGFDKLNEPLIDTLQLSRKLFPGISHSLSSISARFGFDHASKHRAYGDAYATAQFLSMIIDELEKEGRYYYSELSSIIKKKKKVYEILIPDIEEAIKAEQMLQVKYLTLGIVRKTRIIKPLEILEEGRKKLLYCYCNSRQDYIHLRLDRIIYVKIIENI